MKEIENFLNKFMPDQHFDSIAVSVIDFKNLNYESLEWHEGGLVNKSGKYFFDLASLTKPLTLASVYLLDPKKFSNEMKLLLNHRAGLTSGGRISPKSWREYISSFEMTPSPTLYSDYSALRLMLEIEKVYKTDLYSICSYYWDEELLHWSDLVSPLRSPVTGVRHRKKIQGVVHDDNAYYLKQKVSHAGLFGTIDGISKSLINLENEKELISFMSKGFSSPVERFLFGWDTVTDPENSLAGKGCSKKTFGHLGFTGTSIWIDCEKKRGAVILTNATQNYWYDRKGLTKVRKGLGQIIWNM